MTDDTLRTLATRAGISSEWTDQANSERRVSPETLRAILMGFRQIVTQNSAIHCRSWKAT
jgi:hypothetical protein